MPAIAFSLKTPENEDMDIRRTAIIGLGAVGSYFYEGLVKLGDRISLYVIAEGERKERLQKNGITINGVHYTPSVVEYAEDIDLILVATKYAALKSVLPVIKQMTNPKTTVISLLNGVDSEEIMATAISEENILYSVMKIYSHRSGRTVTFDRKSTPGVVIGEKNGETSERMLRVKELMESAGLGCTLSDNIIYDQWYKFASNCSGNLPQAVLSVGAGCYSLSSHIDFIAEELWKEVALIANRKGIELADFPFRGKKRSKDPATRWSTLQDLDSKRHTEIDTFSGRVVRMGEELGIPTPYNSCIYHLIKALEEKNDGLFDFI